MDSHPIWSLVKRSLPFLFALFALRRFLGLAYPALVPVAITGAWMAIEGTLIDAPPPESCPGIVFMLFAIYPGPCIFPSDSLMPALMGTVLVLLAICIRIWALASIGLSFTYQVKQPTLLCTSGPFAYVRHPVYATVLPFFMGFVLALNSWLSVLLIAAMVWVLFLRARIEEEERMLRESMGEKYEEYCKRVPWRLVPGIY